MGRGIKYLVFIFLISWVIEPAFADARGKGCPIGEAFLGGSPLENPPGADPSLHIGTKVYVHYNQHGEYWTVRVPGKARRLLFHAKSLYLEEAEFQIEEERRKRALKTGVRLSHAGVVGILKMVEPEEFSRRGWTEVDYHPWEMAQFETTTQSYLVRGAGRIYLSPDRRVFATSLEYEYEEVDDEK